MAVDKLVDSSLLDASLADIADAIRTKGGTEALLTLAQMPQAIADLPSGGEVSVLNAYRMDYLPTQTGYNISIPFSGEPEKYFIRIYDADPVTAPINSLLDAYALFDGLRSDIILQQFAIAKTGTSAGSYGNTYTTNTIGEYTKPAFTGAAITANIGTYLRAGRTYKVVLLELGDDIK